MDHNNFQQFRVKKAPPSIYYIPNFISVAEEAYLMKQVYAAPKPKWTQLSNRRLQNWGGLPHPKGMVAEDLPQWLQMYGKKIAELGAFENKMPNHVLVNEYEAGQGIMPHEDGPLYYPTVSTISLGSHTLLDFYKPLVDTDPTSQGDGKPPGDTDDKPSADEQVPNAATSLEARYTCSVLLQPRSLILVRDDMYKVYLHGIAEVTSDTVTDNIANLAECGDGVNLGDTLIRSKRISLTIRHVPKTLKAKVIFGRKK